jgi:hypothetical protein
MDGASKALLPRSLERTGQRQVVASSPLAAGVAGRWRA